jgi:hypothetical protein
MNRIAFAFVEALLVGAPAAPALAQNPAPESPPAGDSTDGRPESRDFAGTGIHHT